MIFTRIIHRILNTFNKYDSHRIKFSAKWHIAWHDYVLENKFWGYLEFLEFNTKTGIKSSIFDQYQLIKSLFCSELNFSQ